MNRIRVERKETSERELRSGEIFRDPNYRTEFFILGKKYLSSISAWRWFMVSLSCGEMKGGDMFESAEDATKGLVRIGSCDIKLEVKNGE